MGVAQQPLDIHDSYTDIPPRVGYGGMVLGANC